MMEYFTCTTQYYRFQYLQCCLQLLQKIKISYKDYGLGSLIRLRAKVIGGLGR